MDVDVLIPMFSTFSTFFLAEEKRNDKKMCLEEEEEKKLTIIIIAERGFGCEPPPRGSNPLGRYQRPPKIA